MSKWGCNRCLFLACVLACSALVCGQVQNGQFQGTILDQSGAAVPNATVTATNRATGQTFNATSSNSGFYTMNQLPIGSYDIKASAKGFKTAETKDQTLNAGVIKGLNFKLVIGEVAETVEVTDVAVAVNTEDARLSNTVGATQISNLPLNGRNVYDLIQLNTGAVNVRGVMMEGGANTVVNGIREDFNGFTVNGVSNKGLSGGNVNQPIQDTVQEFQQLSLNLSAQYGNSAGSITNLVTKSGTNSLHGSVFEFIRNDALDANFFFNNQIGNPKSPLRFNQFGGTFGGPLIKDKLFFFASYQGDRFNTSSTPSPITVESPQWRAAVAQALPSSVAALMYRNFAPGVQGACNAADDLSSYVAAGGSGASGNGFATVPDYLNPATYTANGTSAAEAAAIVARLMPLIGPGGAFPATGVPFTCTTVSTFKQQVNTPLGNLFEGNEGALRLDYNHSDKDRFFTEINWQRQTDHFGPGLPQSARGFSNPVKNTFPNFQFNFIHTFSPRILNELKAGYLANVTLTHTSTPGIPAVTFDDGSMGFGSYNGYPQFFKENVYTYSDIVSISHGNHNLKVGADVRRNIENSEFDISRPSYYFFDPLFFAADSPYGEVGGVDPGFVQSRANPVGPHPANLATNIRHWRNIELGSFFQDDWKISRRLTLNLGLRYDLFKRHSELDKLATTFVKGPGTNVIDNITTGAGWLRQANDFLGTGNCLAPAVPNTQILQGVCGPGGFAASKSLGEGDHNNFGPRVGFAWDVFGDGKTSLRGGYGASYEGTLYNPLSNSRWNPPYYSFNSATNDLNFGTGIVNYGPQTPGSAPRFTGPPDPANGQGPGANSVGNIMGWNPNNPDQAILTGIVLPEGIRDPYVHNFFLSLQHELVPKVVMQIDYVGTAGHKLFRAEDINRLPGGRAPALTPGGAPNCFSDNLGRLLCGHKAGADNGRLNPNYGRLRNWLNVANSNYNALQASLKTQSWHNVTFNLAYTYAHSIDNGSTWHSGATTSNGAAAGEGFTTDQTLPGLDRGNSIYDVRHRLVINYVYELPWFNHSSNGFLRNALGGWQWNAIWSYQTGAHWEPWCARSSSARFTAGVLVNTGCDFNLDSGANDRPNVAAQSVDASHDMSANGWGGNFFLTGNGVDPTSVVNGTTVTGFFTRPCAGCVGNAGRNNLVGPNYFGADMSVFKNFRITERVGMQFRAESFNVFNRTNFELPGANSSTNNRVTTSTFGQAGGTFFPRQLQFGLKLSF